MDFRLGLDIGIASVGWCLLDNEDRIMNAGVRLFPEAKSDENQTRRARRGTRRLLRRRHHRLERVRKLLFEYKIINNENSDFYINEITPYELRRKGLYEKLSKRELAIALYHLVKRRGAGDFNIESSNKDEDEGTKGILLKNQKRLEEGYICESQLKYLEENKKIRGINNNYKTTDYIKEAKKILEIQKEYYSELDNNFEEKYIDILSGRRKYFEGPGKGSAYGWKNQEEWMDKLVGNCTYFPEELRLVKNSYTAELFNLLNDLNNLKIKRSENDKLTKEEKLRLIELFKTAKTEKSITLKKIASEIGVEENDILGYRIDKNEKPQFTFLKSYVEINKIYSCDNRDILDEISKIATYYQDSNTRKKEYEEILKNIDEETLNILSEKIKYTGTHSLSKKAINLILDDLIETSKNQMELFTEKGLVPYKMDFTDEKYKYIPKKYVDYWIISPVVKRSLTQCINVINEILKTYGTPKEIVIELAREKNLKEQTDRIKEAQKKNENERNEIKEMLEGKKLDKRYFELLRYWKKQDGICMYSGEYIPIENLISNPLAYEIDHIIPRSISFDDSQNNKVLVKRIENQQKGQRTPYEYFNLSISKRSYENFKAQVLDMYKSKKITIQKRDNLLLEDDISKYSRTFIARNLVDTRYATIEFMNLLRRFFKDKQQDVKIKNIKGSFTSQIRKQWDMTKNRDISHSHHAQDAYIILMGEKILNNLKWVKEYHHKDENIRYHISTGEILDDKAFKELFNYKYSLPIKEYKDYKYSHFVDKKPNRQLMNETIYSTRKYIEKDKKGKDIEKEYVISKISNIYDPKSKIVDFFKDEKKQKQLLIYKNDPMTFEKLLKVYNEYKDKKGNPFYFFYEEYKKYITKYAKKDNGPVVMDLKYKSNELGNYIDITHKYSTKKKRVIMDTIPTYRADVYYNGKDYKFISVRYTMLKDKGQYFEIDNNRYEYEKIKKEIDDKYQFIFSIFSGDIIEVQKKDGTIEKVKFKGVNDDEAKKFEIDFIDKNNGGIIENLRKLKEILKNDKEIYIEKNLNELFNKEFEHKEAVEFLEKFPTSSKQKFLTIGKDVVKFEKIYINVLGKEYISQEKFENIIKK